MAVVSSVGLSMSDIFCGAMEISHFIVQKYLRPHKLGAAKMCVCVHGCVFWGSGFH